MQLAEFKAQLSQHPGLNVRFKLPNGEKVAAHAHVTEVALIDKKFADCGGTFRTEAICRLQTWVADDLDHRLDAGTLLKILNKAASFLPGEALDVDVEHELDYITQFPIGSVRQDGDELAIELTLRHTDCLAKEKCCPAPAPSILQRPNPLKFQFASK